MHTHHSLTMDDGQEAIPLMAQEEYTHEFNGGRNASALKDPERPPVKSPWSSSSILLLLACLVTLISLLFNTFTFSKSWYPFMGASPSYKLDVGKLRRPSLYLGLERVPEINARNGNIHKYLSVPSSSAPSSSSPIGWPAAVARVSSAYPYFIFPQDGWVFLTEQVRTPCCFRKCTSQLLTRYSGSRNRRVPCYTQPPFWSAMRIRCVPASAPRPQGQVAHHRARRWRVARSYCQLHPSLTIYSYARPYDLDVTAPAVVNDRRACHLDGSFWGQSDDYIVPVPANCQRSLHI